MWTEEDEEQLRKLYRLRRPVEEMARELERSTLAVYLRMERLELYGDEAGYPDGPVDRKRANARPCVTGQNPFLAETAKAFCRSGKMLQAVRPGKQKGGRSSLSNPEIRNNGQKSRC